MNGDLNLDHFFDALPQPYRMISKIIETDIIDSVWFTITRIHPDLVCKPDGTPLAMKRNFALNNKFPPSSISDDPFGGIISISQGFNGLHFVTNSDCCFKIIRLEPLAELYSVCLSKPLVIESSGEILDYSPLTKVLISGVSSDTSVVGASSIIRRVLVSMVVRINVKVSAVESSSTQKKNAQKKNAESAHEAPSSKFALLIFVLDAELLSNAVDGFSAVADVANVLRIDLTNHDSSFEIDFSPDGFLLVTTAETIHAFASIGTPNCSRKRVMGHIHEADENDENDGAFEREENKTSSAKEVTPSFVITGASLFPEGGVHRLWTSITTRCEIESSAHTGRIAIDFAVFFEKSKEWVSIQSISSNVKGPKHEVQNQSEKQTALHNSRITHRWKLSAMISMCSFSDSRSVAAIGLSDGSVLVWNLKSGVLTSTAGRHHHPISCLRFWEYSTSALRELYLVSGSVDGSVCFYKVSESLSSSSVSDLAVKQRGVASNANPSSDIVDIFAFRDDLSSSRGNRMEDFSIVEIHILDPGLALVHAGDERILAYDILSGQLLGDMVMALGQHTSRNMSFHRAVVSSATVSTALDEGISSYSTYIPVCTRGISAFFSKLLVVVATQNTIKQADGQHSQQLILLLNSERIISCLFPIQVERFKSQATYITHKTFSENFSLLSKDDRCRFFGRISFDDSANEDALALTNRQKRLPTPSLTREKLNALEFSFGGSSSSARAPLDKIDSRHNCNGRSSSLKNDLLVPRGVVKSSADQSFSYRTSRKQRLSNQLQDISSRF